MPSAYYTVSQPAVMAIAGMTFVESLDKETETAINTKEVVAREEQRLAMNKWQLFLESESNGTSTSTSDTRLIRNFGQ